MNDTVSTKMLFVLLLLLQPAMANAQTYICSSERVTGFHFMDGKWHSVTWDRHYRYKLSLTEKKIEISDYGESINLYQSCVSTEFLVMCQGLFGQFKFDPRTSRYLKSYMMGYIDNIDDVSSPQLEIGACVRQ